MYAAAGLVVTEIPTPTAGLARVSTASVPATPAATATRIVVALTWVCAMENSLNLNSAGSSPDESGNAATTVASAPATGTHDQRCTVVDDREPAITPAVAIKTR